MPKSSWYGVRVNSVPSDLTHLLLRLDTESKVTPHASFIALAARKLQGSFLSQMLYFSSVEISHVLGGWGGDFINYTCYSVRGLPGASRYFQEEVPGR